MQEHPLRNLLFLSINIVIEIEIRIKSLNLAPRPNVPFSVRAGFPQQLTDVVLINNFYLRYWEEPAPLFFAGWISEKKKNEMLKL